MYERAVLRKPVGKTFGARVDLWSIGKEGVQGIYNNNNKDNDSNNTSPCKLKPLKYLQNSNFTGFQICINIHHFIF